jgi:EmrB/QacA subfamily drug resistance transporter
MSREANPWVVLAVLGLGFFMILVDSTIVSVALSKIAQGLHASLDEALWIFNATSLVYTVLLIPAGRLGDIYGSRRMFLLGLAVFTLGSGWCGFAGSALELIAARLLQGLGGALLTPQALAILSTVFPPNRRGAAFGVWAALAGLAAMVGPIAGGVIIARFGWPGIFLVNVPVGLLALVLTFLLIPDVRPGRREALDPGGVALASLGLFLIVFGLIEGERYAWGTISNGITIPMVMAAGVLVLAAFVAWERRHASPVLPLSLLRNRNYMLSNWAAGALMFAIVGLFVPLMLYLQSALGMTAMQSGLTVFPLTVSSIFTAPLAGRFADRIGGKYVLMTGLLLFAVGMSAIAWLAAPTASRATFVIPMVVAGLGLGCVFAPSDTMAMREARPEEAGSAAGLLNMTREFTGVVSSAVVGAVLQNRLVAAIREEAAAQGGSLSGALQEGFRGAIAATTEGGVQIGHLRDVGLDLPPGVAPDIAPRLQALLADVFAAAFSTAMRPTLGVSVLILTLGALSCLAIRRHTTAASEV